MIGYTKVLLLCFVLIENEELGMKLERCTKRSLQYHFFLVKDVLCKTFPQSWEACRSYGAANVQQLRGPVGASGDGG